MKKRIKGKVPVKKVKGGKVDAQGFPVYSPQLDKDGFPAYKESVYTPKN
jgi:hypothetical protein